MNDEIKVCNGKRTEDQMNRERIGMIKVAMNYPRESRSRKLLLKQVSTS